MTLLPPVEIKSAHDIITQLERLGRKVKGGGRRWTAQCPAHDDNTRSLSVAVGSKQPYLIHCHAGCDFHDVMDILQAKRPPVPLSGVSSRKSRPSRPGQPSRIVARYPYKNEVGQLLYTKLRLEPKSFRFEHASGRRGLPDGQRRVLYRLPELMKAERYTLAFIVEGEKDADRLASLGLVATCTDTGAGNWSPEFNPYFENLIVIVIPDNDDAGREHAQNVAQNVAATAYQVKVLELPDLPEKGDVSDWLDAGRGLRELQELAIAAPFWAEEEEAQTQPERRRRELDKWPDPPAAATTGVVATLTTTTTSLAPIYDSEGTYQDNPMKRHKWLVKHGNQILQEAEEVTVFLLELTEDDYTRFKDRQSDRRTRLDERREFFGMPQVANVFAFDAPGYFVFHTDEREGGEPVTMSRPALYRLLDNMLDHIPDNRNPGASTDWGKDWRGSRGDGREKDEELIQERARFAVAVVKSKREIPAWTGMEQMTVKEIKGLAYEKTRPDLVAMLADELDGKQRKSVLSLLLSRIRMNAVQFWTTGKGALRKAANALGIKLHKNGRGTVKADPIEAYRRLVDTGLQWFTRTGRGAWSAFQEWYLYNEEEDSHDSGQDVTEREYTPSSPVQNNGKIPEKAPPDPYFGASYGLGRGYSGAAA